MCDSWKVPGALLTRLSLPLLSSGSPRPMAPSPCGKHLFQIAPRPQDSWQGLASDRPRMVDLHVLPGGLSGNVLQGYPGFVLVGYGETHRHVRDCHEGRKRVMLADSRGRGTPPGATWVSSRVSQEAGGRGHVSESFPVVSTGKNGECKLQIG